MNKTANRYEIFAREYVIDLNATRAAVAAGYSEKGANVKGSQLLAKVSVRKLVDALLSKRASKLDVKGERVIEELAKLAFFDTRKLFNDDGSLKRITELGADEAAAIAGIEHEKLYEYDKGEREEVGTTVKIKLLARTEALKLLGQYQKLFTEKVEHSGSVALADIIANRRKVIGDADVRES